MCSLFIGKKRRRDYFLVQLGKEGTIAIICNRWRSGSRRRKGKKVKKTLRIMRKEVKSRQSVLVLYIY